MSEHAAPRTDFPAPSILSDVRGTARKYLDYWWLFIGAGVAWIVIALVILQFDQASITTVGVLVGVMFLIAGFENALLASADVPHRWVPGVFAVLFGASAIVCFVEPEATFAGLADMLGFLFLIVGVWWMAEAFLERPINPLWWLTLIAGILMTIMAFWTAGQFFFERAYVLLVFAGVWALMHGVTDISRGFAVRSLRDQL